MWHMKKMVILNSDCGIANQNMRYKLNLIYDWQKSKKSNNSKLLALDIERIEEM